jgi:hypothetical protein
MNRRPRGLLLGLLILAPFTGIAQSGVEQCNPSFSTAIELLPIDVTVLDDQGRPENRWRRISLAQGMGATESCLVDGTRVPRSQRDGEFAPVVTSAANRTRSLATPAHDGGPGGQLGSPRGLKDLSRCLAAVDTIRSTSVVGMSNCRFARCPSSVSGALTTAPSST